MKNRLMILALAVALMVGLVPPSSAMANTTETTADDVKYRDIEDFMHGMGYTSFKKESGYKYIVYCRDLQSTSDNEYLKVFAIRVNDESNPYFALKDNTWLTFFADNSVSNGSVTVYKYFVPWKASATDNVDVVSSENEGRGTSVKYNGVSRYYVSTDINENSIKNYVLYSDVNLYDARAYSASGVYVMDCSILLYESNLYGKYAFPQWCHEAGLNCLASSNENPANIPYSYNSYWHIVRRTSSGKWLLTTIGNSKDMVECQLRYSEDLGSLIVRNFYSDDGTDSSANGYMVNVRQYEYDTDGWKVRTYNTYDVRDYEDGIITLSVGTGVDDTRVLAYTSTDIYSFNGYAQFVSASTEYIDVTDTEVPGENETVTPTPTNPPTGGSSDISGLKYTIKADNTPVRSSYWQDLSEILCYVNMGDTVEVIGSKEIVGEIEPWYQVRVDNDGETVEGWIYGAYVNIKSDLSYNGSDGLIDALNDIVGLISVVPLMVGAVFGFLPTWCLVVVGASFSFMCIFLVVKLIRG